MVARIQCSLGGNSVSHWFACSTFIWWPVLSCCGCNAYSLLGISIHISFLSFSLSLMARILQSFQTVTQFHTVNVTPLTCKTSLLCMMRHWTHLGFPLLWCSMHDCQERPVQLSLRHCTLLGDTFALWQKSDMYIRGLCTVNSLCMWYCLEWNHGKQH